MEIDQQNAFTYKDDPGTGCPLHAHARKANGRDGDQAHQIVRRGMTYGDRKQSPAIRNQTIEDLPSSGVGVLFQCFQADARLGFGWMQRKYFNDVSSPAQHTGVDPVAGNSLGDWSTPQKWPVAYGEENSRCVRFAFPSFITMKGGAVFFAPSMRFFERLGNHA
jgi:deferrochelatase/peroxidase EfeB